MAFLTVDFIEGNFDLRKTSISALFISPLNSSEIVKKTMEYVESVLKGEGTGHDWWHVYRVYTMATHIAKEESAENLLVVQLAALLHDVADWKFHDGDETAGPTNARAWLEMQRVEAPIIDHVCSIIKTMSFKGAKVKIDMPTLEGKIVQDADRLDAMGAIGIGRTFAYGGHVGRPLHDPNISPTLHSSSEEYKKHQGTTMNHFHEKLLLLKDLMNTETAKKIAGHRHKVMQTFVNEFLAEWDCDFKPSHLPDISIADSSTGARTEFA